MNAARQIVAQVNLGAADGATVHSRSTEELPAKVFQSGGFPAATAPALHEFPHGQRAHHTGSKKLQGSPAMKDLSNFVRLASVVSTVLVITACLTPSINSGNDSSGGYPVMFSWHPVFMSIGVIFLMTQGIVSYITSFGAKVRRLHTVHVVFYAIAPSVGAVMSYNVVHFAVFRRRVTRTSQIATPAASCTAAARCSRCPL